MFLTAIVAFNLYVYQNPKGEYSSLGFCTYLVLLEVFATRTSSAQFAKVSSSWKFLTLEFTFAIEEGNKKGKLGYVQLFYKSMLYRHRNELKT